MSDLSARNQWSVRRAGWSVAICAVAGLVLFQFWGNATRGYIHTRSLFYWWTSQWFDPRAETQHGLLIAAVAGWLLWRNLRPKASAVAAGNASADGRAMVAMAAGVVLHLAGYAAQQTRLSIVAFLLFFWGVLALAGGLRWARGAVFPLVFLVLAIPVSFVDSLGFHLRLMVTDSAYAIAHKAGMDLLRNGTQLFSPDGRHQYDVAAACSGIRSLVALVALALLIGYLSFRSWWARLLLAAASLPWVVAGNLLRVVAIVLAGEWAGPAAGERVHTWSGPLVFLFVLGLLLATVAVLRRAGFATVDTSVEEKVPVPSRVEPWAVALVVGVAATGAAVLMHQIDRLPVRSAAGVRLQADGLGPVDLPAFIGSEWLGRRVAVTDVERGVLPPDTGYSRRNYVSADHPDRQVFFSVVLSGRDRTSIHRPELCLVGQGWTVKDRFRHDFAAAGIEVPATVLRVEHAAVNARGEPVVARTFFAYWFVGSDGVEPTHIGMLWHDAVGRLTRFRADRWAYVVMQTSTDDGDEAALARMQAVLAGVVPDLVPLPSSGGAWKKD